MKNIKIIASSALIILLSLSFQASAHKDKHKDRHHNNHNNHNSYQLGFTGHYYKPSHHRKHKRHVTYKSKPYRYYAPRYGNSVKRYNHDHHRGCKHTSHYDNRRSVRYYNDSYYDYRDNYYYD